MDIRFPILQIVGYQNSGKTTLVEKLVRVGSELGLKVATIKHHGHSNKLENVHSEKDSSRHRNAGSQITAVEGGGVLQLEASSMDGWSLKEIIQLYSFFGHDLLIIEGYKYENYPKIVLIKNEEDLELLTTLHHIVAVISWIPIKCNYVTFSIYDDAQYIEWIYSNSEVEK